MSSLDRSDTLVSRFTRITAPLHARLYRIARSLCRDDDQAADLTQETLIRAFCAFDSFRTSEPALPWLCRILRNVHLDSFKTGRARHEVSRRELPGTPDDPYQDVASSSPDALGLLERQSLHSLLNAEIEALEPGQRLVLLLCDVEEMSYQEAAEIAGVPVGTIRSRLARARERLRERLCAKPELSEIRHLFANRP